MARIFVSYKRKDKEKVFKIVRQIEEATTVKCWIDLDGIESSSQFAPVICKAIDNAEVVLFMYSSVHRSVDFKTDWTIKELNYAMSNKKRIVLVNLDSSPLFNVFLMEFGTSNNIDSNDPLQMNRLFTDLCKWLNISGKLEGKRGVAYSQTTVEGSQPSSPCHNSHSSKSDFANYECTPEEKKILDEYIKLGGKQIHMLFHKDLEQKVNELVKKEKTYALYAKGYSSTIDVVNAQNNKPVFDESVKLLEKAADRGLLEAEVHLAELFYFAREYDSSKSHALIASNRGSLMGSIILAWCYRHLGDKIHYVDQLRKAAEMQRVTADRIIHNPSFELGKILLKGDGVKKNLDEAVKWLEVAVELSYDIQHKSEAIYFMAQALFEQGNKWKALKTLEKSSGTGYGYYSDEIPKLQKEIIDSLSPFKKLVGQIMYM